MAEAVDPHGGEETHEARLVVWEVPPTVECGAAFKIRVGVKCVSGCRTDGWSIVVRDHEGLTAASATMGAEPWPETDGLHHVRVELRAPATTGLHAWEVRAATAADRLHPETASRLGIRTVSTPDRILTVVAVDLESQTPVEGAKVVAHPYRTLTDAQGRAELRVPGGAYRLFVSGKQYFPFRHDCDVTADVTVRAELAVDRELSDDDIWV